MGKASRRTTYKEQARDEGMRADAIMRVSATEYSIHSESDWIMPLLRDAAREKGIDLNDLLNVVATYLYQTQGDGDYIMDVDDIRHMVPA